MAELSGALVIQRYPIESSHDQLAIYVIESAAVPGAGGYIVTGAASVLNIISADAPETAEDAATAAVQATGTITFDDAGTATETITVGSMVYTQEAAPDDVVTAAGTYDIDVGASVTASAEALVHAINGDGVRPTEVGEGVPPHPDVSATSAAGVVTVTARVPGTVGNSIALAASDEATSITLSDTTLTGGVDYAAGNSVKVRSYPNSQTASTTEDDAGDIFVDHGGAANETIRIVALVTERNN